jgi:hypothetical protein
MPSSATITAFYSFSPNRNFKQSHAQNNFDVFRGHLIPIHPSTATSSNNTYDLGSSDYYWRSAYIDSIYTNDVKFVSNDRTYNSKIINTSFQYNLSETTIPGSNLTITSTSVKTYEISLSGANTSTSSIYLGAMTSTFATTLSYQTYEFTLKRLSVVSGVTSTSYIGHGTARSYYFTTSITSHVINQSNFKFFDMSVAAGTHTYFYTYQLATGNTLNDFAVYIIDSLMTVKEV